ncbi:MAG TPA: sugar phosphate nucleotidyltransferase [Candidatus Saccharimonadales bacterium]|nr:sugar phosphate nucleotidyltransferase [Candidatus Saccharimonadales bacterium]
MSELITNAVLIAAGQGSRLQPLTDIVDKAMIRIGYPHEDPLSERPNGIPIIEFSFASLVRAGIQHIAVVQNPNRDVERYYGSSMDTRILLERQGRWHDSLKDSIAPFVSVSYTVQPKEYYHDGRKMYGTGIWPQLLQAELSQWKSQDVRRFLVSEADSLPYNPSGDSPITKLVRTAEHHDDPDMGAILLMPFPNDGAARYGMGQVEITGSGSHFRGIRESYDHPSAETIHGGQIEEYKNPTRIIFNLGMLSMAYRNLEIIPPPANKGEYQITDVYRMYLAEGGQILPVISDPGDEFVNFGDPEGLRYADQRLRGLRQKPPIWDYRLAA